MQILKWLLVNWDSVLLIAMVVALIIYLIKTGQTKILKQIAIKFVTDAEGECGPAQGLLSCRKWLRKCTHICRAWLESCLQKSSWYRLRNLY